MALRFLHVEHTRALSITHVYECEQETAQVMSLLAKLRAPHLHSGKQKHKSSGRSLALMPQFKSRRSSLGCLGSAIATPRPVASEPASWFGGRTWEYVSGATQVPGPSRHNPAADPQLTSQHRVGATSGVPTLVPSQAPSASNTYSVCTYNVLGDSYAERHYHKLYNEVPKWCLAWDHRRKLLVDEILHWSPDVVCMQEVQHFHDLEKDLAAAGYSGKFVKRHGWRRDGCATFWKTSRLQLSEQVEIDFSRLGLDDNVALIVGLRPLSNTQPTFITAAAAAAVAPQLPPASASATLTQTASQIQPIVQAPIPPPCVLLVSNTHLLFDPTKGDTKLGQLRVIMAQMSRLMELARSESVSPMAVVTGDFNTLPGSPLYRFISEGTLDLAEHHRKILSGQTSACVGYQLYFTQQQELLQKQQQQLALSALSDKSTPITSNSTATPQLTVSTLDTPVVSNSSQTTQASQQQSESHTTSHIASQLTDHASHLDAAITTATPTQGAVESSGPHLANATQVAAAAAAALTAAGQHVAVAGGPHVDAAVASVGPHVASAVAQVLAAAVVAVAGQHIDVATAIEAVATAAGAVAVAAAVPLDGRKPAVRWTEQQLRQALGEGHKQQASSTLFSLPRIFYRRISNSVLRTAVSHARFATEPTPSAIGPHTSLPFTVSSSNDRNNTENNSSSRSSSFETPFKIAGQDASQPFVYRPSATAAAAGSVGELEQTERGGGVSETESPASVAGYSYTDASVGRSARPSMQFMSMDMESMTSLDEGDQPGPAVPGAGSGSYASADFTPGEAPAFPGSSSFNNPAGSTASISGLALQMPMSGSDASGGTMTADSGDVKPLSPAAILASHPLSLRSSYLDVAGAEPVFSSSHSAFFGNVDYIWYSQAPNAFPSGSSTSASHQQTGPTSSSQLSVASPSPSHAQQPLPSLAESPQSRTHLTAVSEDESFKQVWLQPVRVLHPPNPNIFPQGMPTPEWGSDHICLVTEFQLQW